ncbi:hypothetical protein PPACK8108_LOCUS23231 [Phakopsora pachyrhizi]|uniref:Uncharacterized protein n=1 Tax=Phakopsora pachyrhizi TaxID=170000 RepID=A0AAV0BPL1_PHAPC|nr:hypothetical protein PPACK8108_LOCUS23231 [Phakopsora pachyrhizi]
MRKSLSLPGEDHGAIHEDDEEEEKNFDDQRKRKMIKEPIQGTENPAEIVVTNDSSNPHSRENVYFFQKRIRMRKTSASLKRRIYQTGYVEQILHRQGLFENLLFNTTMIFYPGNVKLLPNPILEIPESKISFTGQTPKLRLKLEVDAMDQDGSWSKALDQTSSAVLDHPKRKGQKKESAKLKVVAVEQSQALEWAKAINGAGEYLGLPMESEDWNLTVNASGGHISFFEAHGEYGSVRTPHLDD